MVRFLKSAKATAAMVAIAVILLTTFAGLDEETANKVAPLVIKSIVGIISVLIGSIAYEDVKKNRK